MTLASDRILDIRDKINSLEFCLENDSLSTYVHIDKTDILEWLEIVSDRLLKKTSNFNTLLDIAKKKKFENEKALEVSVSNKITNCMSLALKIELLSMKISETKEVKISQYVADFIKDV